MHAQRIEAHTELHKAKAKPPCMGAKLNHPLRVGGSKTLTICSLVGCQDETRYGGSAGRPALMSQNILTVKKEKS